MKTLLIFAFVFGTVSVAKARKPKKMNALRTEIIINAPAETVWQVLTEFHAYEKWNPFIVRSEGEAQVGTRLVNVMLNGEKEMTFKPKILVVEEKKKLEWIGRLLLPGIFDGQHYFEIEPLPGGQVKFINGEHFKGLFAGAIWKKIQGDTLSNFKKMNEALKTEAERQSNRESVSLQ